ncbi:hypothetical protein KFK09_024557 [Dendrobium nobile]|uniref:Uncharacterized protein n=1 Tax=Dendrobium nobile TaxID=94219 RepID=A0A8T3AEC5_DENNO|nr:hypothetical protein KFK09_024557 [Dendrobium nobile]
MVFLLPNRIILCFSSFLLGLNILQMFYFIDDLQRTSSATKNSSDLAISSLIYHLWGERNSKWLENGINNQTTLFTWIKWSTIQKIKS